MIIQNINPSCPLCNSNKVQKKILSHLFDYNAIEESWINGSSGFFFNYYICDNCTLFYVKEYLSQDTLNYLYNKLDNNIGSNTEINHRSTQDGYFNLINEYIINNNIVINKVLEFGPDLGFLSKLVYDYYDPTEYTVIEPNNKVHNTLRSKICRIKIIDTFLNMDYIEDNSIDLIIMVHVADHMFDFKDTLNILNRKLNVNGVLFILNHSTDFHPIKLIMNKKWPPFCLYHPQLFNYKSLYYLFNNLLGLRNIKVEYTYNTFSLSDYINQFLKIFGITKSYVIDIPIKMKLGNIAFIGQKRVNNE